MAMNIKDRKLAIWLAAAAGGVMLVTAVANSTSHSPTAPTPPSTSTSSQTADVVPPPPAIVVIMYGFERHCPANPALQSRLLNKEIMLIPNKAEAQRAMAIANGDILAQRPDFCANAQLTLTIAVQSGQYLDKQLTRAIRCADARYLSDAEVRECPRYWWGAWH